MPALSEHISIDNENDIFILYGIKYSGELFRGFGFSIRDDEVFRILKRDDGVITIQSMRVDGFDGMIDKAMKLSGGDMRLGCPLCDYTGHWDCTMSETDQRQAMHSLLTAAISKDSPASDD